MDSGQEPPRKLWAEAAEGAGERDHRWEESQGSQEKSRHPRWSSLSSQPKGQRECGFHCPPAGHKSRAGCDTEVLLSGKTD